MREGKSGGHKFLWGWLSCLVFNLIALVVAGLIVFKKYEPDIAAKEEEAMENYSSAIATAKIPAPSVSLPGIKVTQKIILDYKYVDYPETAGKYYVDLHGIGTYTITTNGTPAETKDKFTLRAALLAADYPSVNSHCQGGSEDKELAQNYGALNLGYLVLGLSKDGVEYTSLTLGSTAVF
jgi:hypothetical protein